MSIEELKKRAKAGDPSALQALRDQGFFEKKESKPEGFVLSNAQRRLWVIDQMSPGGSPAYNMPGSLLLEGDLDVSVFGRALKEIVRRHESLRTSFISIDGQPRQAVHGVDSFTLEHIDLSDHRQPVEDARNLARMHAARPFDLESPPLFRAALLKLPGSEPAGDERHVFLFNLHHIICDEWSIGVLVNELTTLYLAYLKDQPSPLPDLPLQYKDYTARQYRLLRSEVVDVHRQYWLRQFAGDLEPLDLLTDFPRSAAQTFEGESLSERFDTATSSTLRQISRSHGTSLYVTLLCVVKALLHRYTGSRDITVGCPAAGRDSHDLENQIGFYINTLALRDTILPTDTFSQLLGKVRETVKGGFEHQMYPFEDLLEDLHLNRDLSRSPLFETMVVLGDDSQGQLNLEGLRASSFDSGQVTAKFDFVFEFFDEPDGIGLRLIYNRDLYVGDRIRAMVSHLTRLARAVSQAPDAQIRTLELIDRSERHTLAETWNQTASNYPAEATIHQLFEDQVARTATATAATTQTASWTYRRLDEEANAVAATLQSHNIEPGELVGLCTHRSLHLLAGVIGILKAGGAYVPLDPDYPQDRLRFMIADTQTRAILVAEDLLPHLHALLDACELENAPKLICLGGAEEAATTSRYRPTQVGPADVAYCMYTSGSTGHPKGTLVQHRAVNRLVRETEYMDFVDQVFLLLAPISFDASTLEMWGPLLNGGKLVIMPPGVPSLEELGETICEQGVTTLWLTAGLFPLMVDEQLHRLGGLQQLLAGGDVLSVPHVIRMKTRHPHCRLINGYGPTENTTFTCCYDVPLEPPPTRSVLIGRPISNTRVYIVDEHLQAVPVGIAGELLAAGDGLALGYLNQPELTRERFIPNPVTGDAQDTVYRTGDRVRYLPDGNIEFLGRLDEQVKIRGFRIEPGELESVLGQNEQVREAVAVVHDAVRGGKQLVAYVACEPSVEADQDEIIAQLGTYLRERLPDYMMPAAIIILDQFPLNANGKLDRTALPTPTAGTTRSSEYTAPTGPIEVRLSSIWQEVLGVDQVGADEPFFDLGGNSMKAILLVGRILTQMQVKVHIREVFERPTVRQLAAIIQGRESQTPVAIDAIPDGPDYALSHAQRRLWIIDHMDVDHAAYNIASVTRLRGRLHVDHLGLALTQLIQRHESLRTRFTELDGEPRQIVEQTVERFFVEEDLRHVPDAWEESLTRAIAETHSAFDLEQTPLFRVSLFCVGSDDHVLVFNMHHIISDGWSLDLIVQELLTLYRQQASGGECLAPLSIQYRDYAKWQNDRLAHEEMAKHKRHWLEQLSNQIPVLDLPADAQRPAVQSYRGALARFNLPADVSEAIHELGRQHRTSHFMTCLAVVKVLLHRYTGSGDIIVGAPIAGREHPDLKSQVGFFVNMLTLRDQVSGQDTATAVIERVRSTVEAALDHGTYPFDMLVEELDLSRDMGRNPLFDVVVSFRDARDVGDPLPELVVEPVDFEPGTCKFDLTFFFGAGADGSIGLAIEYSTDLFHTDRVQRMAGHLNELIRSMVRQPGARIGTLDLMSQTEGAHVLRAGQPADSDYPRHATIVKLFEEQAQHVPDAIAASSAHERLTYLQLNHLANHVAASILRQVDLQPEEPVGILMDRSPRIAVAVLAILKAGGAYLPLDPSDPADRRTFIIDESGCRLALTGNGHANLLRSCPDLITLDLTSLSEAEAVTPNPTPRGTAQSLAYIMYTSGSTGRPKGVEIEQRSVVRLVRNTNYVHLGENDRILQAGSLAFDASTFEIWGALLNGGCVCFPWSEDLLEPALLRGEIRNEGVTTMFVTTSLFNQMVEADPFVFGDLKRILTGGEKVSTHHVARAHDANPELEILHVYGPTENTTFTTWHRVATANVDIPIGQPIANTTVYVLNEDLQLCPMGIPGEICTGGDGVARGYLDRPELTRERFVPNPFTEGDVLYRTGDLGAWNIDGTLSFLGRGDDQVKIRGFRIEPGDVEHHAREHPRITEACVLARETTAGTLELVLYYVAGGKVESRELREFLGERLPSYMIPGHFVSLERLPVNRSGKIDRSALAGLTVTSTRDYEAPATPAEQSLTDVLATVLGVEQIGLNDNFFELGGDSIRAIQLVSRLGQQGLSLQVRDLFQAGSVRELAQRVEAGMPRVMGERITGVVPLTPIQEWFFRENEHDLHHFNQAVLLTCSVRLEEPRLRQVFGKLVEQHDMLRATFRQTSVGWCQQVQESAPLCVDVVDLRQVPDPTGAMEAHASQTQTSFDLPDGPLYRAVLYRLEDGDRLLIVIHHLLCDGITWRILLEDLESGYRQSSKSLPIELAERTASYRQWAQGLQRFGESAQIRQHIDFWAAMDDMSPVEIPLDSDSTGVDNVYSQTETAEVSLSEEETHAFLSQPQRVYRAEADVVLLAALGKALQSWHGGDATRILLESHGREPIEDQDLARTVGWFTSMYPFVLRADEADPRQAIRTTKEDLHRVPQHGISYGVARYLTSSPLAPPRHPPRLVFNYLGQFDDSSGSDRGQAVFSFAQESSGQLFGARFKRQAYLEFTGIVAAGCLRLSLTYHPQLHREATATSLLESFRQELVELLDHCTTATSAEKTPADLNSCPLSLADYDGLLSASSWEPQDIDDMYPLAPMQAGLLYQRLLDPESSAYFIQMSFTLRGALDLRDFQAAWCDVVERHPILRTAFVEEDLPQPIQVVLKHRPPEFHDEDLSPLQAADQDRFVEQYTSRDMDRGFDLLRDPLLRFALFRLDSECCRLVWSYHHILLDGWSLGNLFQEFHTLYLARRGSREVRLPPVRPYAHYIEWLEHFDVTEAREFWRRHLHGVEQITSIPILPGYGHEQGYEMGESTFRLTGEASTNLLEVAHRAKVTLSTLLQAAWAVVLCRYHDTHDIVFGAIVSGRPAEVDRVEQIVGLFINAIPVRIQIDEAQTFVDLLGNVQGLALEAEPFHHCPLPEILTLTPLRQGLFDHLFIFENYPTDHATGMGDDDGDLVIEDPGAHDETHYPFNLVVVPGELVEFRLSYNVHAYPEEQIEQVRDHLLGVLRHVAERPFTPVSEIDILSAEENQRLNRLQGPSPSPTAGRTVLDLFHEQVRAVPDNTALILGEKEINYNSLNRRANQLARHLRSQYAVASEQRVAIILDRSENMVVAVLGVLKAGGAYLPIDAAEPADRAAFMLADADVEVVLTDSRWADRWPASSGMASGIEVLCLDRLGQEIGGQDDHDLEQQPQAEDAAYVIYTSGSTGCPKGCVVEHRNLYSYLTWAASYYFRKASDGHFGLFSPLSFDLTVTSLFLPLVRGNTLTVYPEEDDLREIFADMLGRRSRVDTLKLTPSHISLIREFGLSGDGIGIAIVGGEALLPDQVAFLHSLQSGLRVFNEYGPTEATVGCIAAEIPTGATQIPIGRPILGTRIHILDEGGRRVPIGVPGEMYIAGAGVGRGYLNNDGLTAERFLVGAFGTDERMYRSGDVGRWLLDGNVEYLGRSDDQVKIRGFRIEPGEVESCLLSHPRIAQVAVVATPAAELAAYVVGDVVTEDLRQWLTARLPDHMVPSWFVAIDELPLTRNGKLDRGNLPSPTQLATQSDAGGEAPRDELESELLEIWVSVLQVENLGIHDDFYRLGGHSLKATQIVSRIGLTMDVKLGLREFFQHLTVADLAEYIRHAMRRDRVSRIQPAPPQQTYGLSHAQKRLWLVDQLGDAASYNMPQAYLIHGDLDTQRMGEALARIVQRHEILRTAFVEIGGVPQQQVLNAIPLELEQLDLTDRADPESDARDIIEGEAILPFDLAKPPLLRLKLLQLAQQKWVFLMNLHHIVGDGWSLNILFRELVQIFNSLRDSERSELAPLRIQYKDFSEWQNHRPFVEEEKYWMARLAGNPTGIRLPFDFPPTDDRDFTGALETQQIDGEVLEGLRTVARSKQVTLANLLLALFKLFLFRLTKQEDLCVGVSVAGRNHPDLERLIGFFVNVLPIRSALSSDMDFDVLLDDISRSTLEAYDHQDYPFDLIIEKINPDRIANRQPLINVVFAFQNYADVHVEFESDGSTAAIESGGLRIEPFAFSFNTSKFDLTLFAFDDVDRLILNMEYDTGLFRPETIASYLETLSRFAAMVVRATPAEGDQ